MIPKEFWEQKRITENKHDIQMQYGKVLLNQNTPKFPVKYLKKCTKCTLSMILTTNSYAKNNNNNNNNC